MNFFTIRLSKDINSFLRKLLIENEKNVTITDLNQNFQFIDKDSVFLLYVKGGKTSSEWWIHDPDYRGTLFIATLISEPKYYDGNNFKIDVKIEYRFPVPVTQDMCVFYPNTYNTELGPKTKGSQTQAISYIQDKNQILGILRAALVYNPEAENFYKNFFGEEFLNEIKASQRRFIEKSLTFTDEKNLKVDSSYTPIKFDASNYQKNFSQIIYYGVPGSGKSHAIGEKTSQVPDEQKIRVVFHPEYTNADFVGQILPKTNGGNVQYEFKPGPFTKILYRAYHNPQEKYYLIIEEINRGNAAAIFGDVFQLLDRIDDKEEFLNGNTFGIGWSKYFVENDYINNYLRSPIEYAQEGFSENHGVKSVPFGENITFTENTGIRLPPNLSLYATMNTSDQNVFTLDNAFQRRWDMKLVENKFEGKDAANQRDAKIAGTGVTWGDFQTHINAKIGELTSSMGMSSMEDKRLGCWFVKAKKSTISKDDFAEKVLKYLWDDAFKFNREDIFNIAEKSTSLEEIINQFKGDEGKSCNWNIFKDTSFTKHGEQLNNSAESNSTITADSESSSE